MKVQNIEVPYNFYNKHPSCTTNNEIYVLLFPLLWLYSPLLGLDRFFNFSSLYTVGRIPWTGDQAVARPLPTHRTTQTE
jgi:hypothetical protein